MLVVAGMVYRSWVVPQPSTRVGAVGVATPVGSTGGLGVESGPGPEALSARTVKVVATPGASPVMVVFVAGKAAVWVWPPGSAVMT